MATVGNNLHVTMEILLRVPADGLLRLKSVCKSWYAIINNPKFVTEHLSISLRKQQQHLLLKHLVTNNSGKKQIILSILQFPIACDPSLSLHHLDLPFLEDFPYLEIHGHSPGLVCLSDLVRDIFLCNPTTREIRKLPPSIIHLTEPPTEPRYYESTTMAIGFGYDPKSRDFKVVRIVNFTEGYGLFFLDPRVEIYDLSKDRWREIKTLVPGHVFWMPSFEMYHEGTYYWWAYNQAVEHTEFIQSFDTREEVFGRISVPESINIEEDKWEKYWSMGVLNGSVVLFHYLCNGNEKTFDIWEMKKDESVAVVSWTKLLSIGPTSGIDKPLLFVSPDELLMVSNEEKVILYSIKTQQIDELPMQGDRSMFQATFLFNSLLSVKGGNNTMSYGF